MKDPESTIPKQVEGEESNSSHSKTCSTLAEAHNLFSLAKDRLRDISRWHELSGPLSARFAITDSQGNEVYKIAEKGDVFYINLPAPGPLAGGGKEWVRIESLEIEEDAVGEHEYISITVRPVASPTHPDQSIAHFFTHASTNTFIAERYENVVTVAQHGRNESPNNSGVGIYDTVRNTIVALAAREGLSIPQWKSLVTGILEK